MIKMAEASKINKFNAQQNIVTPEIKAGKKESVKGDQNIVKAGSAEELAAIVNADKGEVDTNAAALLLKKTAMDPKSKPEGTE